MAGNKIDRSSFESRCKNLGGKLFPEDDRLVCEVTVNNSQVKFVYYPDGTVAFDLPKPLEDVLKKFYVG